MCSFIFWGYTHFVDVGTIFDDFGIKVPTADLHIKMFVLLKKDLKKKKKLFVYL